MSTVRFEVPGSLLPWQRAARSRGKGFTSPEQKDYQQRVGWSWVAARGRTSWPTGARYAVAMLVTWPNAVRRDIDNAAKQVLDGLTGIAWDDDSQVDVLLVVRTTPSKSPCVRVAVSTVAPIAWAQAAAWWVDAGIRLFVERVLNRSET